MISEKIVKDFARLFGSQTDDSRLKEYTVYGEVLDKKSNDMDVVRIDGSDYETPCYSSISVSPGDRVSILLKNRTALVTGTVDRETQTIRSKARSVATNVSTNQMFMGCIDVSVDSNIPNKVVIDHYYHYGEEDTLIPFDEFDHLLIIQNQVLFSEDGETTYYLHSYVDNNSHNTGYVIVDQDKKTLDKDIKTTLFFIAIREEM